MSPLSTIEATDIVAAELQPVERWGRGQAGLGGCPEEPDLCGTPTRHPVCGSSRIDAIVVGVAKQAGDCLQASPGAGFDELTPYHRSIGFGHAPLAALLAGAGAEAGEVDGRR